MSVDRALASYEHLLTPGNIDDERLDPDARQAIRALAQGTPTARVCALAMLAGAKAARTQPDAETQTARGEDSSSWTCTLICMACTLTGDPDICSACRECSDIPTPV